MSTDSGEEKTEETDGEEDKDRVIAGLKVQLLEVKSKLNDANSRLDDAKLEMEAIKLDLWREKDINNALLNERRLSHQLIKPRRVSPHTLKILL